jgi:serine/threonine protein kinase
MGLLSVYRSPDLAFLFQLLEKITSQKYITEIEVARIIRQLLEGIEYMHSKGIGHLGLTPCDILFSRPGGNDIKICDFSLARRIVGSVKLDYGGQPEFVAPEIVNMEGAGFGSDMWSCGIITYLLLCGVSPFRGQVTDRLALSICMQFAHSEATLIEFA